MLVAEWCSPHLVYLGPDTAMYSWIWTFCLSDSVENQHQTRSPENHDASKQNTAISHYI